MMYVTLWFVVCGCAAFVILYSQGRKIMAAIDDLTAAANRLVSDVKAIAAKLSNTAPDDSAAVEAIATELNAAADAADQALNPAVTPPTTPPPAQ